MRTADGRRLATGLATLLVAGCRSGTAGGESSGPAPVAVVIGEPVSRAAFERELRQLRGVSVGHDPSSSLGSPPWYRRRGSTPSDTTASSRPTRGCGPGARTYRVPWAQLLKKVFAVEVLACLDCGGRLQVIAFIADDAVAGRILLHLGLDSANPARATTAPTPPTPIESSPPSSVRPGPFLVPVACPLPGRANPFRSSWTRATSFRNCGYPTRMAV